MDRFEVRNKKIETLLRDIAGIIHENMPAGWGFCLNIFTFGSDGDMFYISDANREDMVIALQEFIDKQKKGCT